MFKTACQLFFPSLTTVPDSLPVIWNDVRRYLPECKDQPDLPRTEYEAKFYDGVVRVVRVWSNSNGSLEFIGPVTIKNGDCVSFVSMWGVTHWRKRGQQSRLTIDLNNARWDYHERGMGELPENRRYARISERDYQHLQLRGVDLAVVWLPETGLPDASGVTWLVVYHQDLPVVPSGQELPVVNAELDIFQDS